jgi:hypothetical protein
MTKENMVDLHSGNYSAIKKNRMSFTGKWMELENIVKENKPESERQQSHDLSSVRSYIWQ